VQLVYLQGDQSNGERSSTRPPHIWSKYSLKSDAEFTFPLNLKN
jgi:hypothetical protein